MALPLPLPEVSHQHAVAWLTTLARAFVLPVLGCALLLSVAPGLPARLRSAGPLLVRGALVLLVLAAYGPLAGELAGWGPGASSAYRAACLVVVVCALALVVVLPLLAESLGSRRALPVPRRAPLALPPPPPSPRPWRRATSVVEARLPREAPVGAPAGGAPLATAVSSDPARPRASPADPPRAAQPAPAVEQPRRVAVPRHRAPLPPGPPEATEASVPRPTAPEDRPSTTPPRIPPVRPDETVRVAVARPPQVQPPEPLSLTRRMVPAAQRRLRSASAAPPPTPLQARGPLRDAGLARTSRR
jgi:hypothetical protein